MSVNIINNYNLNASIFLDNRKSIENLNTLKSVSESGEILYPYGFEVFCVEEGAYFVNVAIQGTPEWEQRMSIEDEMISFTTTYSSQKISELLRTVATIQDDIISNETTYSSQKIIEIIRSNMGDGSGGTGIGANINDEQQSATTTYSSQKIESVFSELRQEITRVDDDLLDMDNRVEYLEGEMWKLYGFDGSYNSLTNKPSLEDYATKEYVDISIANAQINGGDGGSIDLSDYATKEYVDEAIDMPHCTLNPPLNEEANRYYIYVDELESNNTYYLSKDFPKDKIAWMVIRNDDGSIVTIVDSANDIKFARCYNSTLICRLKSTTFINIFYCDALFGGYDIMLIKSNGVWTYTYKPHILSAYNDIEFTPTKDYAPATKKYVDDAVANSGGDVDLLPINNSVEYIKEMTGINQFNVVNGTLSNITTFATNKANGDSSTKRYINANVNITKTAYGTNAMFVIKNNQGQYCNNFSFNVLPHSDLYNVDNQRCLWTINSVECCNGAKIQVKIYSGKQFDSNFALIDSAEGYCCIEITIASTATTEQITMLDTATFIVDIIDYNYLALDGKLEYTPTADYHPATKKYVDDSMPIKILPYVEGINNNTQETVLYSDIDVSTLEDNCIYMTCPNNYRLRLRVATQSGTFINIYMSYSPNNLQILVGAKTDELIELIIKDKVYTVYFATETEEYRLETTPYFLANNNTTAYTPTGDYNPATKKYVDDMIAQNPGGGSTQNVGITTLKVDTEELDFIKYYETGLTDYNGESSVTKSDLALIVDNNIGTVIFEGYEDYPYKVVGAYRGFNRNEKVILELAMSDSSDDCYTIHRLVYGYSDDMGVCFLKSYYGDLANSGGGSGDIDLNDLELTNSLTIGTRDNETGGCSLSIGDYNEASGWSSVAIGEFASSTGTYSFALGYSSISEGTGSFSAGEETKAYGKCSHAEGRCTTASGDYSHAEGYWTSARKYAHAEGSNTTASGEASHAEGIYTKANGEAQHVQGKYNIEDTANTYAHIVGNGNSATRSNAHTLDWDGNAWFAGQVMATNLPWSTLEIGELIVEQTVLMEAQSDGTGVGYTSDVPITFVEGEKICFTFNGEQYICETRRIDNYSIHIGNGVLSGYDEIHNNEPFAVNFNRYGEKYIVRIYTTGEYVGLEIPIKIEKATGELHKLDEIYLPNTVATKEYVDEAVASGGDVDLSDYATKEQVDTLARILCDSGNILNLDLTMEEIGEIFSLEDNSYITLPSISASIISEVVNGESPYSRVSLSNLIGFEISGMGSLWEDFIDCADAIKCRLVRNEFDSPNTIYPDLPEKSHCTTYVENYFVGVKYGTEEVVFGKTYMYEYNHVTKKYVDEAVANNDGGSGLPLLSSICKKNEDGTLYKQGAYYCLDFDLIPKDVTETYYDDISTSLGVLYSCYLSLYKDENLLSTAWLSLRSVYPFVSVGYRTGNQLLSLTNSFQNVTYDLGANTRTLEETYSITSKAPTSAVLTKTNTTEYTPTTDYHPATKKYVDEAIANSGDVDLSDYATIEYVDDTKDFLYTEMSECQNNFRYTTFNIGTITLNEYFGEADVGNTESAGRIYYNLDKDISAYNTGSRIDLTLLDTDDKIISYSIANTKHDVNMNPILQNVTLPSGTVFTAQVMLRKNIQYDESFNQVQTEGKCCLMITFPKASNTEAITTEFKTLKLELSLYRYNFLTLTNKNEFVPAEDYHPATKKYVDEAIANSSSESVDLSGYALKTELHEHTNKTVIDTITSDMFNKWNQALPFNDTYASDCNAWLTNGYIKTGAGQTSNLPSACTGSDRWGILFFIAENVAQGTGTQMYFPIDGTYKGRIFVRSLTNMKASGSNAGAWTLLSTFSGDYNDLINKPNLSELKINIVNGVTFANAYINYNNGEYVGGGGAYACEEYVPIISGATYEVSGVSNIVRIAYYDSSKAYINQYVDNTPTFSFTPPSNASYIRLHVESSAWQDLSIASEVEDYIRACVNNATSTATVSANAVNTVSIDYVDGLLARMETLEEKIKVLEERIRTLEEGE